MERLYQGVLARYVNSKNHRLGFVSQDNLQFLNGSLDLNMLLKSLVAIALTLTFTLLSFVQQPAWAADLESGAQVFELHCAGCHINGGNIVRRGKNLKLKALQRNGMDSIDAIAEIVTNGKNNMSAYSDRLTSEQIQDVAAYVWEQAQQGWRSP